MLEGGEGLLSLKGLEDVIVYTDSTSTASTTTNIYVKVKTECGNKSLVSLLGAALADVDNFVIKNAAGTEIVPTAAALQKSRLFLHEVIGMLWYRLSSVSHQP